MPKTSEMKASKYLGQADCQGRGLLLTVSSCARVNVADDDKPPAWKYALTFRETAKPLVLNATNIDACEEFFHSDDTDQWIGRQLVAYVDPSITFGGKRVGGVRVRAPKFATPPPPPVVPRATEDEVFSDDIPF